MSFGKRTTVVRLLAGLSMNAVARSAGIDPAYVMRIERGQHTPSREVVLSLARALGMDIEDTDRYLFLAGYAPNTDWQSRAADYRRRLEIIELALVGIDRGGTDERTT